MRKFIAIAALAGIALFSAGCESKSSSKPASSSGGSTATTEAPASDDSALRATCQSTAGKLSTLWGQYETELQSVLSSGAYTDASVVSAAAEAGHALVNTSRKWVSTCGDLYPSQASQIDSLLNQLEPEIDKLG